MIDDDGVVKWTIVLTGEFDLPNGGKRRAVVITEKGGGNVRLKKRGKIRWTNSSDRSIRLSFEDWPGETGGTPDPLWPFSTHLGGQVGGQDAGALPGSVTVAAGGYFEGQVAGIGPVLIKYTVSALVAGMVDPNVVHLDPMIVIER